MRNMAAIGGIASGRNRSFNPYNDSRIEWVFDPADLSTLTDYGSTFADATQVQYIGSVDELRIDPPGAGRYPAAVGDLFSLTDWIPAGLWDDLPATAAIKRVVSTNYYELRLDPQGRSYPNGATWTSGLLTRLTPRYGRVECAKGSGYYARIANGSMINGGFTHRTLNGRTVAYPEGLSANASQMDVFAPENKSFPAFINANVTTRQWDSNRGMICHDTAGGESEITSNGRRNGAWVPYMSYAQWDASSGTPTVAIQASDGAGNMYGWLSGKKASPQFRNDQVVPESIYTALAKTNGAEHQMFRESGGGSQRIGVHIFANMFSIELVNEIGQWLADEHGLNWPGATL